MEYIKNPNYYIVIKQPSQLVFEYFYARTLHNIHLAAMKNIIDYKIK